MPPLNSACISSLGIERCTWKCSTARQNTRWKVGISSAPAMVASDAETSSQRKSDSKSVTTACDKFDSTRLARNGPRKEFEVRETNTSMLNSASETAMRRVRTPAMRTEYASVPIRWMTKVSEQITSNCLSIAALHVQPNLPLFQGRDGQAIAGDLFTHFRHPPDRHARVFGAHRRRAHAAHRRLARAVQHTGVGLAHLELLPRAVSGQARRVEFIACGGHRFAVRFSLAAGLRVAGHHRWRAADTDLPARVLPRRAALPGASLDS